MAHQIEGFVSNQSILISDNLFYAGNLFIEMMMYTAKLNTFMTRGSKIQSPLQLRDFFTKKGFSDALSAVFLEQVSSFLTHLEYNYPENLTLRAGCSPAKLTFFC